MTAGTRRSPPARSKARCPVDAVGAVRRFRLADGGELREQLLSLSDDKRTLTYCLLEAPLPLMGYVATIRLKPVTDGDGTFWEWRSEFRPPEHRREELTALVRDGVYRAGFAGDPQDVRGLRGRPPLRSASPTTSPPIDGGEEMPAARPGSFPLPLAGGEVAREARRSGGSNADQFAPPWPGSAQPSSARATTRAIVVERYGGPEVLEIQGDRRCRLRHRAKC